VRGIPLSSETGNQRRWRERNSGGGCMQVQLGNITIKTTNKKLLQKLKKEAIRPSRSEHEGSANGLVKLEAFLKREKRLRKKLAVLKAKILAKYGQRKFKRRDRFGLLRLSEWEKQMLHLTHKIPFQVLNRLKAETWREFKQKLKEAKQQ